MPRGGPTGGDGGHGGSVSLVGQGSRNTLYHLRFASLYAAERGRHGEGSNKTGQSGADLDIPVPLGTVVYDKETGELLGEILEDGQRLLVAHGGRGGKGNAPLRHRRPTRRRAMPSRAARAKSASSAWSSSCSPTSASSACPTPASRR